MNAIAEAFSTGMTASSAIKGEDQIRFASSVRLFNRLADALYSLEADDLYESEEKPPRPAALVAAVFALSGLSEQDAKVAEIEPYFGELSLIWKSGRSKRVKAMFRPEKDYSYSVYHERMVDGRVVEHHLETHLDRDDHSYLRQRLAWLHT